MEEFLPEEGSNYWSSQLDEWDDGNAEYFLEFVRQRDTYVSKDYDDLEIELQNIFNCISILKSNENWQMIIDFLEPLFSKASMSLLFLRGYRAETVKYLKIGIEAYEKVNDEKSLTLFYFTLADTYNSMGMLKIAEEMYLKSLDLANKHDIQEAIPSTIANLGRVAEKQGNYQRALELYSQSMQQLEQQDKKESEVYAGNLYQIGMIFYYTRNIPYALHYLAQAMEIFKKIENIRGISNCLHALANIQVAQGQFEAAYANYNKSLEYDKLLGNPDSELITLQAIGNLFLTAGTIIKAEEFFKQSLTIAEKLNKRVGIATLNYNLGMVTLAQGKYEDSFFLLQKALIISEELGDKSTCAYVLKTLGELFRKQNHNMLSIKTYIESAQTFEALGNPYQVAIISNTIGIILLESQNDPILASKFFSKSLEIAKSMKDKTGMALNLYRLAKCATLQKDLTKATELLRESYAIFEQLQDIDSMSQISMELAMIFSVRHSQEEDPDNI